jgi:LysR family positive regulator for ilvC
LIVPPFGITRDHTESWFRVKGVEPTYYSEVPSHEAILSLVSLGCGVGVVPELVLEKSALREDVRPLKVRPSLGSLDVGACVRRASLRGPLIKAFWDLV